MLADLICQLENHRRQTTHSTISVSFLVTNSVATSGTQKVTFFLQEEWKYFAVIVNSFRK